MLLVGTGTYLKKYFVLLSWKIEELRRLLDPKKDDR
jgi:hypothetical protein